MNEHGLGKGNEGATNPVESIIRVMMMTAMRLSVCVSVSLYISSRTKANRLGKQIGIQLRTINCL